MAAAAVAPPAPPHQVAPPASSAACGHTRVRRGCQEVEHETRGRDLQPDRHRFLPARHKTRRAVTGRHRRIHHRRRAAEPQQPPPPPLPDTLQPRPPDVTPTMTLPVRRRRHAAPPASPCGAAPTPATRRPGQSSWEAAAAQGASPAAARAVTAANAAAAPRETHSQESRDMDAEGVPVGQVMSLQ